MPGQPTDDNTRRHAHDDPDERNSRRLPRNAKGNLAPNEAERLEQPDFPSSPRQATSWPSCVALGGPVVRKAKSKGSP